MPTAFLTDRKLVKVAGADARRFLNNLVTAELADVAPGRAAFAALLTPQGKIIVDFFVVAAPDSDGGTFFLDCPAELAAALAQRLTFYRLRAKIDITDASAEYGVRSGWDDAPAPEEGPVYPDPRFAGLGWRAIVPRAQADAADAAQDARDAYHAQRIACGIPQGGLDFAYGETFPHEADMDQLGGVAFAKGCYIGQEVVSRVEHRGTARSRVMPVAFAGATPAPGTVVMAGDKEAGAFGSAIAGHGLAMLRLDRAADARAGGLALTAAGTALRIRQPRWASAALRARLADVADADPLETASAP